MVIEFTVHYNDGFKFKSLCMFKTIGFSAYLKKADDSKHMKGASDFEQFQFHYKIMIIS